MTLIFSWFKSTKAVYSLWWIVWMILYAIILQRLGYSREIAIYDSLLSNVLLGLVCMAIGNIILYYQPSKNTAWKLIVWCLLASGFWTWISQWALGKLLHTETAYLLELSQTLPLRFAIGFLTIGCTTLLVWIWEFVAFSKEDASRQTSAMALAKEAELSSLHQQLQPHFLFNSLNSISALIGSRPQEARQMIQQLSDFLRGTLKKDEQKLVLLSEEIKHLQLYLDIEKVRFGHRLSTRFDCEETSLNMWLPPLLLQPLVENAIKFGLYDTTGDVEILLMSRVENNQLRISIQNPYDSQTSASPKGTGFGLKSVARRLFLLYTRHDLLETSTENNTFTTTLLIPQNP